MEPFGFVRCIRYGNPDSGSRREPIKKATSRAAETGRRGSRATIGRMSPRHTSRRPRASVLVIVVAAVLFAACGSADPSASPSTSASAVTAAPSASPSSVASPSQVTSPTASGGAPAASGEAATNAIYDAVETQVQALRGLTAVRPVPRQLITADELRTMFTKQFDEETPPAYLAGGGTLLQGARPDQARRQPANAHPRPAERRRCRVLPGRPGQDLCPFKQRHARRDRALLLLARIRPRAPGPAFQRLQGPEGDRRPKRQDPCQAGRV